MVDPEGVIRLWDERAEALFGHGATEAIGQTLELIVPAELVEAHWAGFHRAMADPKLKDLAADLPVRCAGGEIRTSPGAWSYSSTGSARPSGPPPSSPPRARRASARSGSGSRDGILVSVEGEDAPRLERIAEARGKTPRDVVAELLRDADRPAA